MCGCVDGWLAGWVQSLRLPSTLTRRAGGTCCGSFVGRDHPDQGALGVCEGDGSSAGGAQPEGVIGRAHNLIWTAARWVFVENVAAGHHWG
jgi:hypothetical protein